MREGPSLTVTWLRGGALLPVCAGIYSFRFLHVQSVVVTDPVLAQAVISQQLDLPKGIVYNVINSVS